MYSRCDSSLFIYKHGPHTSYLFLYVNDIILIASNPELLQLITITLGIEFVFSMTDLGDLNYFPGITSRIIERVYFSLNKNDVLEILYGPNTELQTGLHTRGTSSKLSVYGPLVTDPTMYSLHNTCSSVPYV